MLGAPGPGVLLRRSQPECSLENELASKLPLPSPGTGAGRTGGLSSGSVCFHRVYFLINGEILAERSSLWELAV